jgi:2-polyprenyl-6-methoxyphenol hydroxylase-like FAD-dependent oxidoreductase
MPPIDPAAHDVRPTWLEDQTVHPLKQDGERQRDVIIVGAGLAGSSMAAALAQRGWDVLLVERDRLPRHKVCGEFLSPEAQHSLARLGVLDAVAALAPVPLHGAALTTPGGGSVQMALPAAAWGLSRHALDAGLAAAAVRCGAEFWPATVVTGVTRGENGSSVQVRRQRQPLTLAARAVIFACGRHSAAALPPRGAADGKTDGKTDARRGWRHCAGLKRHYTGVRMEPRVELYLFPGGYVGINPIEGSAGEGRANVCALVTYAAFQALGRSLDCVLAAACARHPALARRLQDAQPAPQSDCAVAPVDTARRPAPWDALCGAPCLGDTAAMIPPLAGDGMAMALRSAELCLEGAHEFLTGALSPADWEAAYTRAWRQEFAGRLRLGRALQSALTTPRLGDGLAGVGRRFPALANLMLAGTRGRMA